MVISLYILRIIAIMMIVNSHLADFYPISSLAFGGHLGNSIFYLISGYGLSLSFQSNPLQILPWLKKRLIKLLIPLVIILIVLNIGFVDTLRKELVNLLVWHKVEQLQFFLPVLLGLYFIFYPINCLGKRQLILCYCVGIACVWFSFCQDCIY